MTIEEFYEQMKLTYLENKTFLDLYKKDERFKTAVEDVKKKAQDVVDSINEDEYEEGKEMSALRDSLKSFYEYVNSKKTEIVNDKDRVSVTLFINAVSKSNLDFEKNQNALEENLDLDFEDEYDEDSVDEDEKEQKQKEPIDTNTIGVFTKIVDKLNAAKTKYNSSEYNNLVKYVTSINTVVNKYDDTPEGYAAKLIKTKELINKYLNHKAKGNVKQNVYNKLAAVEVLNKVIENRLFALTNAINDTHPKVANVLNETIFDSLRDEERKMHSLSEEELETRSTQAKSKDVSEKDINDMLFTDDCMRRIIARAPEGKVKTELKSMRKKFLDNPSAKPLEDTTAKVVNNNLAKAADNKQAVVGDDEFSNGLFNMP